MAGRGTRCYLAVDLAVFNEPTSTLNAWINSKHPILECLHLLKTSWQSPLRTPEFEFYHRISQRAKELRMDIPHMATMLAGGRIQGSLQSFGPVPEGSQPDRNAREIHWILLKETGRPLGTFNDSKQLLQAIEDTAVTIRQLSRCDVLHRDVSINNVLINVLTGRGLLVDFDAARDDRAAAVAGRPGITGTPDFLALALESQPLHAVWHDYESLYWVSVFAILRHMPQVVITHRDRTHNLDNSLARAKCMDEIFGARTQPPQMSGKYDFLREADYVINNNMAISSYMERTSSHLEALYNTFAKIKSIIKQLKSILSSTLSSEDNSSDPSLLSGPYDPLEELQVWTPQQHSTLKWLKNYTNANHHGLKGERDVQDHLTTLLECCDTLACLSGRLLTDTQAILVQDRITQIRSDISSLPHISFPGHGLFSVARFRAYGFSSQAAVPYRVPFQTDPMERMRLGVGRLTAVTPYERRHRTGTSFSAFTGDI
ncbi:hypothetical protein FRC17_011136 [Serendipita sp. 399]|nr:hypothetical protein FRC17_011136 [Serendipita sp. 399]